MKVFKLLLSTFLYLISFLTVSACICNDYGIPPCKTFSDSEVVFVGKITKITSPASEKRANKLLNNDNYYSVSDGQGYVGVEFTVEKSFKGAVDKTIKAYTYIGTSCSLEFKKGEKWKISAIKEEPSGLLTFSKCTLGNYHIEDSSYDTSDLEAFSRGEFQTPIIGRIAREFWLGGKGFENSKISLTGNGLDLTTVSDKYGWFDFPVTKAGKYKIKVTVPFVTTKISDSGEMTTERIGENETTYEYEAEVKPNSCDYRFFELAVMKFSSLNFIPNQNRFKIFGQGALF